MDVLLSNDEDKHIASLDLSKILYIFFILLLFVISIAPYKFSIIWFRYTGVNSISKVAICPIKVQPNQCFLSSKMDFFPTQIFFLGVFLLLSHRM